MVAYDKARATHLSRIVPGGIHSSGVQFAVRVETEYVCDAQMRFTVLLICRAYRSGTATRPVTLWAVVRALAPDRRGSR